MTTNPGDARGEAPLVASAAAHLVEEVLPNVPVRQWVLSAPFELRLLLARKPDAVTALDRIFVDEISRVYRRRAEGAGLVASQTGAVTFVHRFGGSLNLHVHVHVVAVDGVFTLQPGERAVFHAVASPTQEELSVVTDNVARRMLRWLARAGYLRDADDGAEPELDGIARCFQLSLAGGTFLRLDADAALIDTDEFASRKQGLLSAQAHGFSLHAAVRIAASDRPGRERLLRYGARPSLSLERLSQLPNGRIAYALKRPGRRGATHRVMEPLELMARLAALVPPPWHPLTRFHGVLASHHGWRAAVVPEKQACGAAKVGAPPKPAGQLALALEGKSTAEAPAALPAKRTSTYLPWAELAKGGPKGP